MDKNTSSINVRLPDKLYKEIKVKADSNNINMSAMIRMMLTDYFNKNK